jgi:hypothetical protein
MLETGRAQYHLRQSCVFLNMFPLNRPEVMIAQAQNKFDDQGRLTEETTFIGDLLVALADWTRRLDAKAEERRRLTASLTDERPGSVGAADGGRSASRSVWQATAHSEYQLGDCLAKRSAKRWFICTGSLGKNSSRASPHNPGTSATIRAGTNFRENVGRLHAAHRALEVILALAGIEVLDG